MSQNLIQYVIDLFFNNAHNIIIVLLVGYYFEISMQQKFSLVAYRYQQNIIRYFSSCFIILQFSISLYYILNKLFSDFILLSSGLLLIPWLIMTGAFINELYNFLISNLKSKIPLKEESEKLFIVSSMGILVSLTMIPYEINLSFTIISIMIGRFFWIDTGTNGFKYIPHQIKLQINNLFKFPNHPSILKKTVILFSLVLISNVLKYWIFFHPISKPFFNIFISFPISTSLICILFFKIFRKK